MMECFCQCFFEIFLLSAILNILPIIVYVNSPSWNSFHRFDYFKFIVDHCKDHETTALSLPSSSFSRDLAKVNPTKIWMKSVAFVTICFNKIASNTDTWEKSLTVKSFHPETIHKGSFIKSTMFSKLYLVITIVGRKREEEVRSMGKTQSTA